MTLKSDAKFEKKTDLKFGKWHEEYGKFSPEHLKNLKIGTLMGSIHPMLKMYELKIYRGAICHDNEEWCKIRRRIGLSFQNWHKEFDKFWPEHSKVSKICTLIGSFWTKYVVFELKKYKGVMFGGTEDWCKYWSQYWDFEGILLFKVENVWA